MFIGVNLTSSRPRHPWPAVPHIPTLVLPGVIIGTLAVTVVARILQVRRDRQQGDAWLALTDVGMPLLIRQQLEINDFGSNPA